MTTMIQFEDVSKHYRLGQAQTSLRESIANWGSRLLRRQSAPDDTLFQALNHVSFDVQAGDILGIIGHNGAGKSTILKLLSKVTFPTSGHIHTTGRMAALIELGAGFHPDLSGRENIFLNGAILGLKEREIRAQFDDMVAFAGLEKFIDTPVKRYSSGMYVRLAFAVAAHIKADILLIDEVLSVGDTAFQQKCLDKMRELHRNGATIVFISHSMWTVQTFCNRALLMRNGQVEASGKPDEVIDIYRQYEREDLLASNTAASFSPAPEIDAPPETALIKTEILNMSGREQQAFDFYDRITVRAHYHAPRRIDAPLFVIRIARADGLICCAITNNNEPGANEHWIEGEGFFELTIGPLPLVPDIYSVEVLIADRTRPVVYAHRSGTTFRIKGELSGSSDSGVFAPNVEWHSAPITEPNP